MRIMRFGLVAAAAAVLSLTGAGFASAASDADSKSSAASGGGDAVRSDTKPDVGPYLGWWTANLESVGEELILRSLPDGTVSLSNQHISCQGTLNASAKPAKVDFECLVGDGDAYRSGTITDVNDKDLTVKWASGESSEFRKAEGQSEGE